MPSIRTWYLVASLATLSACGSDLVLPNDGGGGGTPGGPDGPGAVLSAADDRFTTLEGADRTLSVPSPGVLGNDLVNASQNATMTFELRNNSPYNANRSTSGPRSGSAIWNTARYGIPTLPRRVPRRSTTA